ncbi:hypothetical protein I5677_11485 [Mobilitalea sibirica]|uniref:Uncharacterized protein n=1 Tax=Mobilitalea sibirica TaxID=1462919 RepID=A0A8J7HBV2_9FIRM|nr:hypothetical protein [Mobilitalea sibirica]MBH1941516.1 hypothetical protein [Mobilitalea sibirica]
MLWVIVFLLLVFVYEKLWRVRRCIRKIHNHIESLNGCVTRIDKVLAREEIFRVYYRIENHTSLEHKNVKFSFFYKERWY